MSLIDAYEEELESYTRDIRANLTKMRETGDNAEYESTKATTVELLAKGNDIIKAFELEVRTCAPSERREYTVKLKAHKDNYAAFKTELTTVHFERQKASLTSVGGKSGEDRRRMLDANQRLAESNLKIEQSLRTLGEIEEVGGETITELQSNREKIASSQEKVKAFILNIFVLSFCYIGCLLCCQLYNLSDGIFAPLITIGK